MTAMGPSQWLAGYDPEGYYCEMLGSQEHPARHTEPTRGRLAQAGLATLRQRAADAERELFNLGITFTVYADGGSIDRILPFDVIPRILSTAEWARIEAGVKQRVAALNLFLHDVYHDQKILADGVVPKALVLGNANYRPEMVGIKVPENCYVNICGIDIVRGDDGEFRVLEDNARTPSGVSYVIENRFMMRRAFPELFEGVSIRDIDDYGMRLANALTEVAPASVVDPEVVLMSPGVFNSAYFEHVFLAREMGVPLVEGSDLIVEDDHVFMRTTAGLAPVHCIYRRINDDFLDPDTFRPDSALGVRGLFSAYRKGNVTLANAVGTGVCDDKAIYAYMPRIIRYYLDQDPVLQNVETHICGEPEALAFTLENLSELVIKPVGEAGGYGITVCPLASANELETCRKQLKADPANYISQPMVRLSVCPTLAEHGVAPRHVDLRPFAVTGKDTWVLPGGLSRVALREGSMIVNSSQGGGSKDTWVLA